MHIPPGRFIERATKGTSQSSASRLVPDVGVSTLRVPTGTTRPPSRARTGRGGEPPKAVDGDPRRASRGSLVYEPTHLVSIMGTAACSWDTRAFGPAPLRSMNASTGRAGDRAGPYDRRYGGPLIRLVALAVALALILSVVWIALGAVKSRLERRMPRLTPRQRHYDWEPRTQQIARQLKVGAGPEDRDRILAFLDSRAGVEAFVEAENRDVSTLGRPGGRRRRVGSDRAPGRPVPARAGPDSHPARAGRDARWLSRAHAALPASAWQPRLGRLELLTGPEAAEQTCESASMIVASIGFAAGRLSASVPFATKVLLARRGRLTPEYIRAIATVSTP